MLRLTASRSVIKILASPKTRRREVTHTKSQEDREVRNPLKDCSISMLSDGIKPKEG